MSKKYSSKLVGILYFLAVLLFAILVSSCSSGKKPSEVSQEDIDEDTNSNDGKDSNTFEAAKLSLYLKGDNLYMVRYDNSEIIDLGPCTTNGSVMEKFSITGPNKKLDLFCSFSDYDGETYTLYTSTSKSPTKRTKVADNVTKHSILKNGDILYISNKELFLYKDGKAVSLFKEKEGMKYILSKDQKKLLIVPDNPSYGKDAFLNVYLLDIYKGINTVYSDFNINSFDYSYDFDAICYFKDNTVYQLKDGISKEIIKGIEKPYNYITFASDNVIYASKSNEPTSLYKFDFNGNEELISDSLEDFVRFRSKKDLLAYTEKNSEGKSILKVAQNGETLGEYEDIKGDRDVIDEALPSKSKYWYFFSEENKKLWRVALEGSTKGEIELVNKNITNFSDYAYSQDSKVENDNLLYRAIIEGNDYNTLFLDGNIINKNIGKYYSPAHLENNGTEIYIICTDTLSRTSYKDDNDTYHIWENGNDTVIAKNVKDYNGFHSHQKKFEGTYFLTNYDYSKGTGLLKQYINGELKDIDSGVKGFVWNNTSSFSTIFR
jgi:lipoprotein